MDQRSTLQLEITKDDNIYSLSIPYGAPYGQMCDVAVEFLHAIWKMREDAQKKMEEKIKQTSTPDNSTAQ